jgi:hypothetical protein
MRRVLMAATAVVIAAPLFAACSGGGTHTAVLGTSTTRAPVGCSGHYALAGGTVTATISLTGPVWSVTVAARLADGSSVELPQPVAVVDAVSQETLRLRGVPGTVTAVAAHVDGSTGLRGTCQLSNPH